MALEQTNSQFPKAGKQRITTTDSVHFMWDKTVILQKVKMTYSHLG